MGAQLDEHLLFWQHTISMMLYVNCIVHIVCLLRWQ